jgi:glycosyltransferase involved in cell wall biosynthesis
VRSLDHADAHYCVLSADEARLFPQNWGVPAERVHVTPFHWVLDERSVEVVPEVDGGVFAGGDSLRDYGPLFEAAAGLPAQVTIASRTPRPARLPENVTLGPLDSARYDELFRRASVVVVPLEARRDRSAGQQTYLNAMVLGKPVVVTDATGVRDYVEDGETGLIVPPGDARALRGALEWALDPENGDEVRALGERARAAALERFGPERYVERLLEVVDEALARRAERGERQH